MARTRQEVISEMADSGLFTDDEIRDAVKNTQHSNIPKISDLVRIGSQGAQELAMGMARSGTPPISMQELKALSASPSPGTSYGVLKPLEEVGQNVTNVAYQAVKNLPPAVQTAYKYRPGDLTPSSAAAQIGAGALAEGATTVLAPFAKAALAPIGRGIANTLEMTSGLTYKTPGVLREAFEDPSLIRSPGLEEVRPAYKAAKVAAGGTENLVSGEANPALIAHKEIIDRAMELAKVGKLNPAEAQTARMSVDALGDSGSYSTDSISLLRNYFNKIAKSSEELKNADVAFGRAIKGEALKEPFPVNKTGGTSIMKLVTGVGATKFLGPLGTVIDAALLSPAVQGMLSTGAGIASRNAPSPMLQALLSALARKKEQTNAGQ